MTLSLVLMLALSQTEVPQAALPSQQDQSTEPNVTPEPRPREPPSVFVRSLLGTGAGTLAGGASLGIALLLVGNNPSFDPTFATAALSSLMICGVAFAIHEALGGRGEITLSFLFTAIVMAGAAVLANAVAEGARPLAPILTAAIGALPAAAAAVFGLEATSPKPKNKIAFVFGPTGFSAMF